VTAAEWPGFLLDLTLWHAWHQERGTLPVRWKGMSLPEVCRALRIREWTTRRPWRIELAGVGVREEITGTQKTLFWETNAGTLSSAWTRGPDGDWWQSRYPVQSRADFDAAMAVAEARRYIVEITESVRSGPDEGLTAIELPQMPLSEIFHAFLGWSDGLMLFLDEPRAVMDIVDVLDRKQTAMIGELAPLASRLAYSPDNLDGQFMTETLFEESLAPGYARTARLLHAHGTNLTVHVGGPVSRLLPGLARCGVDCVQGVCGAPQGDTTLSNARALCGPDVTLWGGIAQDYLLATHSDANLEREAAACFEQASADLRIVVGAADKVPAFALPGRIQSLADMAASRAFRSRVLPE
jgi:hypothetical protein